MHMYVCMKLLDIFSLGLLLTSQLHNATQLSSWCLHFIASNFAVYESKEEFAMITGRSIIIYSTLWYLSMYNMI